MSQTPHPQTPANARNNILVLAFAQAFGGAIGAIAISLGAISGAYLLSPEQQNFATLPVATYSAGVALFALPVSLLCLKFGRRLGFISGAMIGILGAFLACLSLLNMQFQLFCLAFLLIGGAGAFVQQYRFAAADQGSDKFKSRAISWVLTGGVLAAIIGTDTARFTKDLLLPTPYAGGFLGMIGLLLIGGTILLFLKPIKPVQAETSTNHKITRPVSQIIKQPIFFISLLCAVSCYGLMTFMMTGAPLAMIHHGHSEDLAILGIKWHVMAMFAPSFITGHLISAFGKIPMIAFGLSLLLACAAIALSGLTLWNFWVSLILLGIGWNFGFIGSTALLGESYTPAEKNKVQGVHDTILFSIVALAALLSGTTFNIFGWHGVAIVLVPVISIALLSLLWLSRYQSMNPNTNPD